LSFISLSSWHCVVSASEFLASNLISKAHFDFCLFGRFHGLLNHRPQSLGYCGDGWECISMGFVMYYLP
jgi:hypothetical protein